MQTLPIAGVESLDVAGSGPKASPVVAAFRHGPTGRPLDETTRRRFEGSFGVDLGGVRIHDDGVAQRATSTLNANAFAVGRDVFFASGQYRPSTTEGSSLLGHELAHVVQQSRGGRWNPSATSSLDAAADAGGQAAARGDPAPVSGASGLGIAMSAKAMIWEPHVDGYGHAALKLCDGTYISWWPAGGGTKTEQYWSGRPGGPHTEADDLGPGGENMPPDHVYDLGCNCLDEQAIKAWYDAEFITNPSPKWAVLRNSCSDIARQALNKGSSVTNPCYASISHTNLFWTPNDFALYAECQERWCKSKAKGALSATGRYLWENTKEALGGGVINFGRSLWYKGEIILH